jgi:phosphotransferase system IIA component
MWKFIEDLKKDFDHVKDEVIDEKHDKEQAEAANEKALTNGKAAIEGDKVVALEDGTVEMINQNSSQIEIYFDKGNGIAIHFPFGPAAFKVEVSANEKVKKGQTLVQFGPAADKDVQVYAFTPDLIQVLTNSRYRIN